MQATGPMKVGAAFLAGIVVALGSAMIYVKSSESHIKPVMEIAPAAAEAPAPRVDKPEVKAADPEPAPPVQQASRSPVAKPRVTRRPVSLAVPKPAPMVEPPIEAKNLPPVQAAPAPVPTSAPKAVNDSQPFAPPQSSFSNPTPAPPQPHTVTLAAGTEIAIRLGERISTDHNYSGDTFRATLDKPLVLDGFVIAEKGSKVLGKIVKAQKPGKMSGLAELSVALTELNTTDGQRVPIETNESLRKGPSNTNQDVMKMGGGAALGAIIGAIAGGGKGAAIGAGAGGAAGTGAVLLGHGKPAVMESETRLSFQLASPTTITERLN